MHNRNQNVLHKRASRERQRQAGAESANSDVDMLNGDAFVSTSDSDHTSNDHVFPPQPPSKLLIEEIINGFCADSSASLLEEAGCMVCGLLQPLHNLTHLSMFDHPLDILAVEGATRVERLHPDDPVKDIPGPVIDPACNHLQDLSFAERMMIARIRHNRCLVRVSSGRAKMTANVIMYSNPTLKVYHELPPSKPELDEVLAFIFTGPTQPTEEEFKRSPMLVRRNKVADALEWLKLNHKDYIDLEISKKNLQSYPLIGVPVAVDYRQRNGTNRMESTMSLHDEGEDEGTVDGPCPFTVHGLSGTDYGNMSIQALKAKALQHIENEGKMLAIGHDPKPQSMYDNPQAYPQMFPWLFPYGYGGIGQHCHKRKLSESEHKRILLMHHDKRFQRDLYFPIIAFNHEQLKGGVTGSFLVAKRRNFDAISKRLLSIDKTVLQDISSRLVNGDHVSPETDSEKDCYKLLDDLDHVGGYVKGSITSKKYMRNEIWLPNMVYNLVTCR
ncbi:hypothetical protein JR316_0006375 [Psilocybe cubensis]|uniref:Uncharacterized protein n=2 Tax=Psilocybe cubensis TaxID=181762 RepID=A0ACB8GXL1_PSICU|nr:hypothetical protein JR316_0007090 [Psilocybe cubensis]XP_047749470.1 hypothetical protein JR316_0006375 [Psilocybe cubensis]KAH9480490.1 hypothetical protein JR316_0007090 [Psilocybe cubensis]KAH9481845.1 hypothetical protein JR316_0006375 [Psilocybe cubensis]